MLKPGEDVPTINSLRRDSGQGLLSAANGSVMRVAKMRKGQVCVCLCKCVRMCVCVYVCAFVCACVCV